MIPVQIFFLYVKLYIEISRFLTALKLSNVVFWVVMPCDLPYQQDFMQRHNREDYNRRHIFVKREQGW
jgi:hypothetical protein